MVQRLLSLLSSAYWRVFRTSRTRRQEFNHWLKSLVRLYSDDTFALFEHTDSPLAFRSIRTNGQGYSCDLLFQVVRLSNLESEIGKLRQAFENSEYEILDTNGSDELLGVKSPVPNIWADDAASTATRVVFAALAALEIPLDADFLMSFRGTKSVELRLETLRRIKSGEISWW